MCLDPPVRVFDGILPIEHLDALKECCRTFFQAKPSRGRYSSGKTFWSEWNQAPRCELEALALAILHQHCPSPAANAGVEWWTLCLDESSEVAWHWDRDYSLERSGVNVHPMLGTVTYLSQGEDSDSAQLSTLTLDVLSSVQRTGEDVMLPPSGGSAWCTVVPPRLGRHLAFDGRFLHGATAPRTRPCRGQRVTFLANIWVGHQPGNASPLPTDLQAFTGPESMRSVDKALSSPFPLPTQAKVVEIAASDEIKNFPLEGGELRVVPPPGGNDLEVLSYMTPASWSLCIARRYKKPAPATAPSSSGSHSHCHSH
ncbi:unnamed protein product [Durusdinium trenchii]